MRRIPEGEHAKCLGERENNCFANWRFLSLNFILFLKFAYSPFGNPIDRELQEGPADEICYPAWD